MRGRILLAARLLTFALMPTAAAAAPASSLSSFGLGAYGQLGDGGSASSPVPLALTGLPGVVTAVAAGCFPNLALTGDGAGWARGLGPDRQLGGGTPARHT